MDLYGLIGKELSHSYSEQLFTEKFAKLQLHASYELFPLEEIDELPALIRKHDRLVGLNVTIPYKCTVMPYLDEIDYAAKIIGAVNTIKIVRKRKHTELIGYNTDVHGFTAAIEPLLHNRHDVHKALVLGTGGASKAVQYVLRTLGIGYTEVSRYSKKVGQLSYPMVTSSILKTHLLIINTTPVGMFPNQSSAPDLMYKYIGSDHILIDLIYNPQETKFLELGKRAGASILNGQTMFEKQAEEAWKIWQ
jgi:shikimate dehydrogenase